MLQDGAQLLIDCDLYHDVGLGPALPRQPGVDVEGRVLATDEHG
jgi:hypothetical protein